MDTDEKYLGDEFFVTLSGERGPDWYIDHMESRDSAVSVGPATDRHALNADVPVDGFVTFYDPGRLARGEPFKHGTFPFRSVDKPGPWLARPENDRWDRSPVWKWQNPDADPHDDLTLSPSIGLGDETEITFHCYIRDGEIDWL